MLSLLLLLLLTIDTAAEVSNSKVFGATVSETIPSTNVEGAVEGDGVNLKVQEDEGNSETTKGDTEPLEDVEETPEAGDGEGGGGSEEGGEDTVADENLGEDKPPDTTDN